VRRDGASGSGLERFGGALVIGLDFYVAAPDAGIGTFRLFTHAGKSAFPDAALSGARPARA
jgi:hypothetical protein